MSSEDSIRDEIGRVLDRIHMIESEDQANSSPLRSRGRSAERGERRLAMDTLKHQLSNLRTQLARNTAASSARSPVMGTPGSPIRDRTYYYHHPTAAAAAGNNSSSAYYGTPTTTTGPPYVRVGGGYAGMTASSPPRHTRSSPVNVRSASPRLATAMHRAVSPPITSTASPRRRPTSPPPPPTMSSYRAHSPRVFGQPPAVRDVQDVIIGATAAHLDTLRDTLRQKHELERRQLQDEYERNLSSMDRRHRAEHDALTVKFQEEERLRHQFEQTRTQLEASKREIMEMVSMK
eukprot:PhM_4_TR14070/c0_g1_i1/m.60725